MRARALDGGDNPHISYHDWGNDDLKYAYYEAPVGGVWVPLDKPALLTPYIALATTVILVAVATVVFVKHKKKKQ